MRAWGKIPKGGHNLLTLWDVIKEEIVDRLAEYKKALIYEVVTGKKEM